MSGIKKTISFLLMLVGLILSFKLFNIYMEMNFNPYAEASFCNINSYIDCDGVAKTTHSRFLGIPLALWGIFLYLFFIFLLFVDKLKQLPFLGFLKVFKNPPAYIATIGAFSFLFSMFLAFISIFEIEKICILCFVTYFINLSIGLISRNKELGFWGDLKTSFKDFYDAIKSPQYLIALLFCILLFATFLRVVNDIKLFQPPQKINSVEEYAKLEKNPYKISGNILGEQNADVIVHLYTDYYCPYCRVLNIMLYKATMDLSNIRIIHHDFPLDSTCNPSAQRTMHPNACMTAAYVMAAKKQNKALDMDTLLFDSPPKSEDELLLRAKEISELNTEKLKADANSETTKKELRKNIEAAIERNVDATPTIIIGSTMHKGVMPYDELINLLLDAGAKLKVKSKGTFK